MAPELRRLPATPRGTACRDGCTGVHSYTADGTRWCWVGAVRGTHAIDAELTTNPPPEVLRRRFDGPDFWRAWTALEVVAKLTDTPALARLSTHGLGAALPPGVTVVHHRLGDTLVCLGWRDE